MSDKLPQIIWIKNTLDKQAQHLCFLAKSISIGDFADHGFWVLPYLVRGNKSAVYFPDLQLSGQFWHLLADCPNRDLGKPYPLTLINEMQSALTKIIFPPLNQSSNNLHKENWDKIKENFFTFCDQFLNLHNTLQKLVRIEIFISDFGTAGSYDLLKKDGRWILMVVIRCDFNLDNLVQLLLMAFWTFDTKKRAEIGEHHWQNKMAIIDFLMHNTAFTQLVKKYQTGKEHINLQKIENDSKKFLNKLGFVHKPQFIVMDNVIYFNNQDLTNIFSAQEENLLKLFIGKSGQIIDVDGIGQCFWGEEYYDKFSPYAIAKVIENIRRKLRNLGINRDLILTIRKKGYLFRN